MAALVGIDSVAPEGAHDFDAPEPVQDALLAPTAGQVPVVVGVPTLQLSA